MGQLKPGATYTYERVNGVTYAREFGAPSSTRVAVGWDADVQLKLEERKDELLWKDIMHESLSNEELRSALERVKILYYLSKKDG